MASRASTEKDAVFLNEGVDEFYEGQAKQAMNGYGTAAATTVAPHYPHADVSSDQYHQNSRIRQLRTQYLNKLQPIAQKLPQQYSNDYLCEEDLGKSLENRNQLLSKPYDMNKTRSTGTSYTQKTQQTSNMTLPQPSKLRSDMARKNVKQIASTPEQQDSHPQLKTQQQQKQPASPSRIYSKAMQNARNTRKQAFNRVT